MTGPAATSAAPSSGPPAVRRTVLFVDDEPRVLDGLRRSMYMARARWEILTAVGGAEALEVLEGRAVDVVVSDLRMPGMDGVTFLEAVSERWPQVARVVLSGQEGESKRAAVWKVAHQYLSKPCEAKTLLEVLDRVADVGLLLRIPELRAAVGGLVTLPTAPSTLLRLRRAMLDDAAAMHDIGLIVNADSALMAKVLQVVNSSYFGAQRSIQQVDRALQFIGLHFLRALIMEHEVGHVFPSNVPGFPVGAENRHALRVSGLLSTLGSTPAESADLFTAGMLHDVGKLVLASRAPETLGAALALSLAQHMPLYAAERQVVGVDHAVLGAYLLGFWGLPWTLVEAVRLHHAPEAWPSASTRSAARIAFVQAVLREYDERSYVNEPPPDVTDDAFAVLGDVPTRLALRDRMFQRLDHPETADD